MFRIVELIFGQNSSFLDRNRGPRKHTTSTNQAPQNHFPIMDDNDVWDNDTDDTFRVFVPDKAERKHLHGNVAAVPGASWKVIDTVLVSNNDRVPPVWIAEAYKYRVDEGTKMVDGCRTKILTYSWPVPNLPSLSLEDDHHSIGLPSAGLDESDDESLASDSHNDDDEQWMEYDEEFQNWMAGIESYKEMIKDGMDTMGPSCATDEVKQARLWVLNNTADLFGSNYKRTAAELLKDFKKKILIPYGWYRVPPNVVYEVNQLNKVATEWLRMKQKRKFQYLG